MRPIVKKIAWPPNQWKSVYVDDILDDSRSAVIRKPFLSHGFYHSLLDNAPNSASKEEVKNDLVYCKESDSKTSLLFFCNFGRVKVEVWNQVTFFPMQCRLRCN